MKTQYSKHSNINMTQAQYTSKKSNLCQTHSRTFFKGGFAVASISIRGGRSLRQWKIEGKFFKGVDQKLFPYFSLGNLHP